MNGLATDAAATLRQREWRRSSNARRWVPALLALLLVVSGCATEPQPAVRSGSGEIRHELAPLTDRFPQLSEAAEATWMSGTMGDDRAPGPSTYWIDAIVTFDENGYAALRSQSSLESTTELPTLDSGLDPSLPAGPFLRSDTFDAEFSQDGRRTTVFLDDESRSLVLTSWFE
ncbi:hypothetical protein ITJ38_14870 [Agreia pratensis]|uniref:hypothetical protein n=1 Tax=Agreia pratensis TaxID=150121 RepID=UPI00188C109E|nr:hypothetical protein [Agreia pratensis]MBF4635693.1 hypothetical protein [Agreia pratensis]